MELAESADEPRHPPGDAGGRAGHRQDAPGPGGRHRAAGRLCGGGLGGRSGAAARLGAGAAHHRAAAGRGRDAVGSRCWRRCSDALRERHLLLVLDNFEQVLPAGAGRRGAAGGLPAADGAGHEPRPAPPVGRAHLCRAAAGGADGNRRRSARGGDAVAKPARCLSRARRRCSATWRITDATAPAIAAICTRLDGLPLAIELAAARVQAVGAARRCWRGWSTAWTLLTGGPRDAPARQQTLRATIDWSYELLDAARSSGCSRGWRVCGRLDVGGGRGGLRGAGRSRRWPCWRGCTRWWSSSWCATTPAAGGAPRYRMLETIRAYALERLAARAERGGGVARRHAAYYLALAEAAARRHARAASRSAWLSSLERGAGQPARGVRSGRWRAARPSCACAWRPRWTLLAAARAAARRRRRAGSRAGAAGRRWRRRCARRRCWRCGLAGPSTRARAVAPRRARRWRCSKPPATGTASRAPWLDLGRARRRRWRCLSSSGIGGASPWRAGSCGWLARGAGRPGAGDAPYTRALALFRELGDTADRLALLGTGQRGARQGTMRARRRCWPRRWRSANRRGMSNGRRASAGGPSWRCCRATMPRPRRARSRALGMFRRQGDERW